MSRDTMVYYRSFRESLRELPPDLYKVVSETIFDYAFEGIAPGPDSNAVAKALFIAIKPVIDNAHNRYDACVENGRKGGAPKGSRNNPSGKAIQPNQRPNQYPNQEPNLYKDKDVDKDKDIENLLAELNYKRFMFKKLCILLIFSKLNEIKHLIDKYRMHNLYAIFAKLLNICKQIAGNLVNESGNVPRRGVVPKFSDLEVVALNMASEAVGIDSESLLFANLQEYRVEIPNLISRRQYNDRRKITSSLCNAIRERMVAKMDGGEDYFCIDSKPIEVCRIARSKRCSMGKKDFSKAPGVGYCASQSMYYYGYKLHAVCGLSGVIHSFDLTKASVHDIHYLKDVKVDYSNCTVIGDRGYISAQVQLDLFETANIRLEVPYRCNQKEWKPTFPAFAKARKRIETLFSQLCDQFMIIRNYAKDTDGLFARIIGKISALTILQYINYKNEKPIGRVKYALF